MKRPGKHRLDIKQPNAPKIRKTRAEGVSVLLEEIRLALEWNRPSILLAVQKNNHPFSRAETALEKNLHTLNRDVLRVDLCRQLPVFPRFLFHPPGPHRRIYFFNHLECEAGGGTDVYRALNLHREIFIELHICAVFWLNSDEATSLVRFAPDFWVFRHRVVEFAPERGSRNIKQER
jgi:hypothetical protein